MKVNYEEKKYEQEVDEIQPLLESKAEEKNYSIGSTQSILDTLEKDKEKISEKISESYKFKEYGKLAQRSAENGIAGYGVAETAFKIVGNNLNEDIKISMIVVFVVFGAMYGLLMSRKEVIESRKLLIDKELENETQKVHLKLQKVIAENLEYKAENIIENQAKLLSVQEENLAKLQNGLITQTEQLVKMQEKQQSAIEEARKDVFQFFKERDKQKRELKRQNNIDSNINIYPVRPKLGYRKHNRYGCAC